MNKQNMAYTCSGVLPLFKNKWNSDICNNMDEPWRHYARETARHNRTNIVQYYFYEIPRAVRFLETKVEGQFSGPGWQREWGIIVYGYRASVWNVENHPKMDCVADCATISMYLIPLNCTPKNGLDGRFYVHFTTIKIIFKYQKACNSKSKGPVTWTSIYEMLWRKNTLLRKERDNIYKVWSEREILALDIVSLKWLLNSAPIH